MKKKKLTGKLNLKKNKVSNLDSAKIDGGGGKESYLQSNCWPECVTFPNNGCGPSNGICTGEYCDTDNSYCHCL